MNESDRFETSMILKTFQIATELHKQQVQLILIFQ